MYQTMYDSNITIDLFSQDFLGGGLVVNFTINLYWFISYIIKIFDKIGS